MVNNSGTLAPKPSDVNLCKLNYKAYMYIVKHNYRLGGVLFTICTAQLHVSATNIGHLQLVQRANLSISYACICRGCVGCRGEGLGFGLVRNHI